MATNGVQEVKIATGHHVLGFEWKVKATNSAKNSTTIQWRLYLKTSSVGRMVLGSERDWAVTVNDKKYTGTNNPSHEKGSERILQLVPYGGKDSTTQKWREQEIVHEKDGTKTFTFSFSQEFAIIDYGSNHVKIGTISGSGKGVLDPLYKLSTITATNCAIGDISKITIARKNSKYSHTLKYKINNASSYSTIVSNLTDTSYDWTIPSKIYLSTNKNKKAEITLQCITLYDGIALGSTTTSITVQEKEPSAVYATDGEVGQFTQITIKKTASYFRHKISFFYGEQALTEEVIDLGKDSNYKWKIPEASLYELIKNATFGKIKVVCETYYSNNNNTKIIGSTNTFFIANFNEEENKPTITDFNIQDISKSAKRVGVENDCKLENEVEVIDDYEQNMEKEREFLRGFNVLVFSGILQGKNGAKIRSYQINCGKKTFIKKFSDVELEKLGSEIYIGTTNGLAPDEAETNVLNPLNYSEDKLFTISIVDTRGFTSTATYDAENLGLKMIEYILLSSKIEAKGTIDTEKNEETEEYTQTAKISFSLNGNWFNGKFSNINSVSKTNCLYIRYRLYPSTITPVDNDVNYPWINLTFSNNEDSDYQEITNTTYKTKEISKSGLAYASSYNIEIEVWDELKETGEATSTYSIVKLKKNIPIIPIFGWKRNQFLFNIPVKTKPNGFFDYKNKTGAEASLDLNNGDICGCNAIIFKDVCNNNEGILFPTKNSNPTWDILRMNNGHLQIIPSFGENFPENSIDPADSPVYNLCYKVGDTITYSNDLIPSFCGFFSSTGTKTLFITIPFSKPCFGCTSARLSGILRIRTVDGTMKTINMNSLPAEVNSVTVVCHEDTGLVLKILFKEAKNSLLDFSTFQHTPISCSFASEFTITLV